MYDVGKDLKPSRKQNLVMVILYELSKLIDTLIIEDRVKRLIFIFKETGWSTVFKSDLHVPSNSIDNF